MFDSLLHLIGDAPQAYLIVFALSLGDAVFPVLPSETAVILAGVLSTTGPMLELHWVIAAAALGAFIGDNTCYALGRFGGEPVQRRFFNGERSTRALAWARRQLDARGGLIIVVSRFIPGGRTATTFTCGLTRSQVAAVRHVLGDSPRFSGRSTGASSATSGAAPSRIVHSSPSRSRSGSPSGSRPSSRESGSCALEEHELDEHDDEREQQDHPGDRRERDPEAGERELGRHLRRARSGPPEPSARSSCRST